MVREDKENFKTKLYSYFSLVVFAAFGILVLSIEVLSGFIYSFYLV